MRRRGGQEASHTKELELCTYHLLEEEYQLPNINIRKLHVRLPLANLGVHPTLCLLGLGSHS
jgi:hypothetical protein